LMKEKRTILTKTGNEASQKFGSLENNCFKSQSFSISKELFPILPNLNIQ
jgi:hypothetical protein